MRVHKPDKGLIIVIFCLLIFGLIILSSASIVISREKYGQPYYYFKHQLIYGISLGLVAFFVCQKINYKFWKRIALPLLFVSLILSVLVFVPGLGYAHKEARRWLMLGPFSFQPSEFIKLALVIYLASFLSKEKTRRDYFNTLIPFLAILGIIGGLMALQSGAGTLGLIIIVGFIIYFVSGAKIYQMAIVILVCLLAFFILIKFFPYRMERFITFLNPTIEPQGMSYQINQALLSIGSGGFLGVGLGHSQQKYNYLPEAMGDSIFAIIAEEVGFIGALILIGLFILLAFKGLRIAKKAPDDFTKLLSIGITSWLIIQAFINIAANTGLIPLTGIPLPFISYGGSAMVFALAGAGILVNISKFTSK